MKWRSGPKTGPDSYLEKDLCGLRLSNNNSNNVISKKGLPTFLQCGVVLAFFLEPTILEEELAGRGDFDLGLLGDGGIGGRSTIGALEEQ